MNPLVPSAAISAGVVNAVMGYIKLNLLDKVLDPNSTLYDWVTRGLVFLLNLVVQAVVYILSGGSPAMAWQILVAGVVAGLGSLGLFHTTISTHNARIANGAIAPDVAPPTSTSAPINVTPAITSSGLSAQPTIIPGPIGSLPIVNDAPPPTGGGNLVNGPTPNVRTAPPEEHTT